jgi:hypothetical protein
VAGLISFERGPDAVSDLAGKVNGWLGLDTSERASLGQNIADCSDRNWSWRGVAEDLISASEGRIREVREP